MVPKRLLSAVAVLLFLPLFAVIPGHVHASLPQQDSGTWTLGPSTTSVRAGATATVMYDGSVLVAGGVDRDGNPLAQVEILNTDGTLTPTAPMHVARTGHAAVWLSTGYVLVSGGTTSGGVVTNTAEIYDPMRNSWTLLTAVLNDPRSGHTASNLPDGSVLIAGGNNGTYPLSSIEIFSITTEEFSFAGSMVSPREHHSAVTLKDGRIALIGGANERGEALASTVVFDPELHSLSDGPVLGVPRSFAGAATLLDGTVLVAGGETTDHKELRTAEIVDFSFGSVQLLSSSMAVPRSHHSILVLKDSNLVILAGGLSSGSPTSSVEVFTPWTGKFAIAAPMLAPRVSACAVNLDFAPGRAILIGGADQGSTELYAFATVKTNHADYYPGDRVTISGAGWVSLEQVELQLASTKYAPVYMTAQANALGEIQNSDFVVPADASGAAFVLTAIGTQSQAQTAFTDANENTTTTVVATPNPSTFGQQVTLTASVVVANTSTPVTCGAIQFRDSATALGSPVTVDGVGTASYSVTLLSIGPHSITCCLYQGGRPM
ncbi:MAG TPA: kelch repeat-containing protein [Terriglobales bacterium]|nr:kelch repeat-containing protein [Terriglobales bacterium]